MKLGPVKLRFWVLLMRKQQEEFHGLIEELKLLRLGSISEEVKKSFQIPIDPEQHLPECLRENSISNSIQHWFVIWVTSALGAKCRSNLIDQICFIQ